MASKNENVCETITKQDFKDDITNKYSVDPKDIKIFRTGIHFKFKMQGCELSKKMLVNK